MNKHTVLIAVFLAVVAWGFVPESQAQYCDFPPKELKQGQRREYRGLYKNKAYGYSVVIPNNLVGYDDANPLYQKGFGIIGGAEPKSYVYVNGEPNSLEYTRPAEAASQSLAYLGKRGNKVESSKITESQLGSLRAALLVAAYSCPGSTERYVRASTFAISPNKSMLYEITLYTHADYFERDRAVLDALVKSWKHLGASGQVSLSGQRAAPGSAGRAMPSAWRWG